MIRCPSDDLNPTFYNNGIISSYCDRYNMPIKRVISGSGRCAAGLLQSFQIYLQHQLINCIFFYSFLNLLSEISFNCHTAIVTVTVTVTVTV